MSPRRRKSAVAVVLPLVGWRERVPFPELGIAAVKCKTDTRARTASVHALDIEQYEEGGIYMGCFTVHPIRRRADPEVQRVAPLLDRRIVRDSGGQAERPIVLKTGLCIGDSNYPIELTLTRRDAMGFLASLGRTTLRHRFQIDPGRSYLSGSGKRA